MGDSAPEPFGKLLVDARKARGTSLQEISGSTKIPVSKLQAIERDDIGSLPGGIFTRGFVRSYAEAVGLDPQEALAKFERRFPDESSVATLHATIEGRANEEFVRRQRRVKSVVWSGLLAVPVVVWLVAVVTPDNDPPAPPRETVVEDVEPAEASVVEPPPPSVNASASVPPEEPEAIPDPPPAAPTDSGLLAVEIAPTADCWILASADGDTVISRVLGAGEREVVVARDAIDLRIGDAGAFAFTINQRRGRSLGASGEVVNIQLTPSNYLSFVVE